MKQTAGANSWLLLSGLLILAAAALRFQWLKASSAAVGTDSYYYVLQVQALADGWSLYYPTLHPLPLVALAGLSGLVRDPVLAVKLGGVLAVGTLGWLTSWFLWRWTRSGIAAFFAAVVLSCSSLLMALTVDFIANTFGMVALMLVVVGLTQLGATWRKSLVVVVVGLVTVLTTHISAIALTLGLLVAFLLFWGYRRHETELRLPPVLGIATLAFGAVGMWLIFRDPRSQAWLYSLGNNNFASWRHFAPETAILLLSAATIAMFLRGMSGVDRAVIGAILVVVFFVVINPFSDLEGGLNSVAGRLGVWSVLFAALMGGRAISEIATRRRAVLTPFIIACMFGGAVWSAAKLRTPTSLLPIVIQERTAFSHGAEAINRWLPAEAKLIAEHGMQYMAAALVHRPATSKVSLPLAETETERFWVLRSRLSARLERPDHSLDIAGWTVVREDALRNWLTALTADERGLICEDNRRHVARDLIRAAMPDLAAAGCREALPVRSRQVASNDP